MKKILACILALTLTLTGSEGLSFSSVNGSERDYVKTSVMEVAKKIRANWGGLGQKWPGLKYETNTLLILDLDAKENKKRGWVVDIKGVAELKASELKSINAPSILGYNAMSFKGQNALVISVEESILKEMDQMMKSKNLLSNNFIYTVASHEMVHFYYQPQLKRSSSVESRATVYPLSEVPRVYRKMIMLKLIDAYQAKTELEAMRYLSEAKHWNEKWKNEFKNESQGIYNTDFLEGQARYIEYMAEDKNLKKITPILFGLIKENVYTEADAESYELGFLSGLLLDKYIPSWKASYFKKEYRPVDLLLSLVKSKENAVDEKTKKEYKEKTVASNQEIGLMIKDIEESQKNTNMPYLRINTNAVIGSYSIDSNVMFNKMDVYTHMVFNAKTKGGEVSLKGISVFEERNAMGESFYYIPLTMPFEIKNDWLIIESPTLSVKTWVEQGKDDTGRLIYTVR